MVPAGGGAQVSQLRCWAAAAGGHTRQRPFRYRVARMTEAGRSPLRVARLPIATSSPSSTSSTARWTPGRAQGWRRSWADSWIAATREMRSDASLAPVVGRLTITERVRSMVARALCGNPQDADTGRGRQEFMGAVQYSRSACPDRGVRRSRFEGS